jgi:hypothetical protein
MPEKALYIICASKLWHAKITACLAELSQIPRLLLMRDVPDLLLQISPKKEVANSQIRKSRRPGPIAA